MSGKSLVEDIVDSILGGVIGAVIGIYYTKLIPEPANGDYQLKLVLSLVIVIIPFALIKYCLRRDKK